ncbi:MAG: D-lysine 5,6-aminomutase subunit alpha, partial [Bacteroidales bacterium]|nr:D-lysine 5,6-aminomutase subunit alpha [Bacteroidales bacterium]
MQSKVGLDFEKVSLAKALAEKVAVEVQTFVERYTTVATERTIARALGIDGVDESAVPLPNVLVEQLKEKGVLSQGVMFYIANAMIATGLTPQQIAEKIANEGFDIT